MEKINASKTNLDKEILDKICSEITELLIKKNSDYGDSFFELMDEFGFLSFLVRIYDKVGRLKMIHKKGKIEVREESVNDSIRDIIGYCLLYLYKIERDK